jgi:hypothetical protein
MKLHTALTGAQVYEALDTAKAAGHVTGDVTFVNYGTSGSRTHQRGYEIQLGTYCKDSLPSGYQDQHGHRMNVRRYKNTGSHGANTQNYSSSGDSVWAATWDEWGWFIAAVFAADPSARWANYESEADFNRQTENKFKKEGACPS